jgi:hypothetical protein
MFVEVVLDLVLLIYRSHFWHSRGPYHKLYPASTMERQGPLLAIECISSLASRWSMNLFVIIIIFWVLCIAINYYRYISVLFTQKTLCLYPGVVGLESLTLFPQEQLRFCDNPQDKHHITSLYFRNYTRRLILISLPRQLQKNKGK